MCCEKFAGKTSETFEFPIVAGMRKSLFMMKKKPPLSTSSGFSRY
jgi:hypothetical protein